MSSPTAINAASTDSESITSSQLVSVNAFLFAENKFNQHNYYTFERPLMALYGPHLTSTCRIALANPVISSNGPNAYGSHGPNAFNRVD